MNIFFLDQDPQVAAQYHCDKHVVKMILESAQLLATAHRVLDGKMVVEPNANGRRMKRWRLDDSRDSVLYTASHVNHPSAIWVRENMEHYRWLHNLMYFLIGEYKYRYDNKYHKCEAILVPLMDAPFNIDVGSWVDPPQAMPEDAKVVGDSVEAYRNYYRIHKRRMANWKIRGTPNWYK